MSSFTREEKFTIANIAILCLVAGGIIGWSLRVLSTEDKFLVATTKKHFSEAEYHQKQIAQMMKEGSKK